MRVEGSVRPPGDKSITHRAIVLAALSRTTAHIDGALVARDTRSTARVVRRMGVRVSALRAGAPIHVTGGHWRSPDDTLDCGNSGTAARLMLGALAGRPVTARLTGDASLRRRPMRRVTVPLESMGASIEEEADDGLPLRIRGGALRPSRHQTAVASAQVKTALLFAGVSAEISVTVSEPARSRDHTERMLRWLGFPLAVQGTTVTLEGLPPAWPRLPEYSLSIPADLSSAAFPIAAALLAERGELTIEGVGVNPTRGGFLEAARRMGAEIEVRAPRESAGEPVADLVVRPSALRAVDVTAEEIPRLIDEIPILAVLASRAAGESRFRSVGELRVKESDRLGLLAADLRAVGVEASVDGEDLVVVGSDRPPRGRVDTARDHRLAMAFTVLGLLPDADVRLSEQASPGISYPGFFDDLERVVHA